MSELLNTPPKIDNELDWFREQSIDLIATQPTYKNYPEQKLTWSNGAYVDEAEERLCLPDGPWLTKSKSGFYLPDSERPQHPWIADMLDEKIGVVTGKGFYRRWGPNYTADPIIIRTDTDEPLVLMIVRNDTGQLAFPGGFVNPREKPLDAAMREAEEETLIDWKLYEPTYRTIYSGPLADPRMTANAWPETNAYLVELNPELSANLNTDSFAGNEEEVESVNWLTPAEIDRGAFGSHKLLAQLALKYL